MDTKQISRERRRRIRKAGAAEPTAPAAPAEARPLTIHDVADITARTIDEWAPSFMTKSRAERSHLKRLLYRMRNPDLTGFCDEVATEEDYRRYPELRAARDRQAKPTPDHRCWPSGYSPEEV